MKKFADRKKIERSEQMVTDCGDRTMQFPIPPALAKIAAGRDHIQTEEYAWVSHHKNQTVRKNYCATGECFGVRPIKVGNRLRWPVIEIAKLLNGERPSQASRYPLVRQLAAEPTSA